MTIIADKLYKFENGDTAEADEVLTNTSFLMSQVFYLSEDATRTSVDVEGYITYAIGDTVDYSTSTCFRKGNDGIAFCDIMDNCDDGSIDANIWATATTGGGSPTVTEESTGETGYIKVYANCFSD